MSTIKNSANNTQPARLPPLAVPPGVDAAMRQILEAIKERLEVRDGARGNPYERAVTVRDLVGLGLDLTSVGVKVAPVSQGRRIASGDVSTGFERLGAPPDIEALIRSSLAAEAARLGASIRRVEHRLQTESESSASVLEQITASLGQANAGMRELSYVSATANRATAGKVTQLVASLGGVGSASFEQSMVVIADRMTGLRSQYMLNVTAGGTVAGIKLLASEDPLGNTESAFIVQADQFRVKTVSGTKTPFGIDGEEVFINGTLRINAGGSTIDDFFGLVADPLTFLGAFASAPSTTGLAKNSLYRNTTDANLYILSATNGVWLLYLEGGANGTNGTNTAVVYAYKRSATDLATGWNAVANGPGAITWAFSSGSITTPATDALANGWTKTVPAGTAQLYTTVSTAANTTVTDVVAASEWATPARLALNGVNGVDGLSVATAILYQRTATATAPGAQANTVTLTFSTGGMTGMSSGWTPSIPSAASGAFLWVTRATASATTLTDTLLAGEWSAPVIFTQDGTQGGTGDSVDIVFVRSATAPATPIASAGTPTSPILWYSNPSSVPASNNPMWSSVGKKTTGNYTWSVPIRLDGTAVAEVTVFRRLASAPATPTGGTYTFTTTPILSVPALWFASVPAGTDPVYTSRAVVSAPSGVTSAIAITGWTTPVISLQNGVNGGQGPQGVDGPQGPTGQTGGTGGTGLRGSITLYQTGTFTAAAATAAIFGVTSSPNRIGDTVHFTSGVGAAARTTIRYFGGSVQLGDQGWLPQGVVINGSLLVGGSISSSSVDTTQYVKAQGFISDPSAQAAIIGLNSTHAGFAMAAVSTSATHSGGAYFQASRGQGAVFAEGFGAAVGVRGTGRTGVVGDGSWIGNQTAAVGVYGLTIAGTGVVGQGTIGVSCQGQFRFGAYNIAQPAGGNQAFLRNDGLWVNPDWLNLTNRPGLFPPSAHNQDWSTITGRPATFPPWAHGHLLQDIGSGGGNLACQFSDNGGASWNNILLRKIF